MQPPARLPYGVLIWTAIAALAIGLFAGMSLLTLGGGGSRQGPGAELGAETPTREPSEVATPGLSASGAEDTTPAPVQTEPPPTVHSTPSTPADPTALIGLWLSAVSAITALIGLASSLWLGWRKEGREAAEHRLELEKTRLEIRKLQQELAAGGDAGKPS